MNLSSSTRVADIAQSVKNWLAMGGGAKVDDIPLVAIAQDLRFPPYATRRRFTATINQTGDATHTGFVELLSHASFDIVVDFASIGSSGAVVEAACYHITNADGGFANGAATISDSDEIAASSNAGLQLVSLVNQNVTFASATAAVRQLQRAYAPINELRRFDGCLPHTIRKARLQLGVFDRSGFAVAPLANATSYIITIGGYFDP